MEELIQNNQDLAKMLPYLIAGAAIQLTIWLFFANTVRSTLKLIQKENQCILPNQAWFLAVPFFNIYWNFEVVRRLTDSLNNEFFDRKIAVEENPTRKQGYIFAISFLVGNLPLPVFLKYLASVVNFIYLIVYWVKIAECKKLLKAHNNMDSRVSEL
ncbi:hypothetical protein [Sphingobacterium pedocola]|uniref:DUF4328 domain-containing protein n=1 Tax=Sphingobacterium pedocola TaxID=2082722 RepID=A0ABR9T9F8_9SPHI|nr:hypothetical protein [Sphingobacterium pedocola]MBE8721524.1 hypothetical protein [Sphingobacterium pedocola]